MHEALNSRRVVLKDLGARKVEKATRAQLLGERERKGSGGAGSLPSWGGGEMKGRRKRNGSSSNGGCLHGAGFGNLLHLLVART
jgi:hypothetical protein